MDQTLKHQDNKAVRKDSDDKKIEINGSINQVLPVKLLILVFRTLQQSSVECIFDSLVSTDDEECLQSSPSLDILRISAVCRHWRDVARDYSLWRDIYLPLPEARNTGQHNTDPLPFLDMIISRAGGLARVNFSARHAKAEDISVFLSFLHAKAERLEALILDPETDDVQALAGSLNHYFPKLRHLEFSCSSHTGTHTGGSESGGILSLCTRAPRLERLRIALCCPDCVPGLPPGLKELQLDVREYGPIPSKVYDSMLTTTRSLEVLLIRKEPSSSVRAGTPLNNPRQDVSLPSLKVFSYECEGFDQSLTGVHLLHHLSIPSTVCLELEWCHSLTANQPLRKALPPRWILARVTRLLVREGPSLHVIMSSDSMFLESNVVSPQMLALFPNLRILAWIGIVAEQTWTPDLCPKLQKLHCDIYTFDSLFQKLKRGIRSEHPDKALLPAVEELVVWDDRSAFKGNWSQRIRDDSLTVNMLMKKDDTLSRPGGRSNCVVMYRRYDDDLQFETLRSSFRTHGSFLFDYNHFLPNILDAL